jgi:hypothetical protein
MEENRRGGRTSAVETAEDVFVWALGREMVAFAKTADDGAGSTLCGPSGLLGI